MSAPAPTTEVQGDEPQGPPLLRPSGALGRFRASRMGLTAAGSVEFARNVARPPAARSSATLTSGLRAAAAVGAPRTTPSVRSPRWWSPAAPAPDEETSRPERAAVASPPRGLPRAASRLDRESWNPGQLGVRAAPRSVPMRLPAEVAAAGSMVTSLDTRRRTASPARESVPQPSGSGTTDGAPGSRRATGPSTTAPASTTPSPSSRQDATSTARQATASAPQQGAAGPGSVRRSCAPPRFVRRRAAAARTGAVAAAGMEPVGAAPRPTSTAGTPATSRLGVSRVPADRHPGTGTATLPRAASSRALLGQAPEVGPVASGARPSPGPLRRSTASAGAAAPAGPVTRGLSARPAGLRLGTGPDAVKASVGDATIAPAHPGTRPSTPTATVTSRSAATPARTALLAASDITQTGVPATASRPTGARPAASPGSPHRPTAALAPPGPARRTPAPAQRTAPGATPAGPAAGGAAATPPRTTGAPGGARSLRLALVPDIRRSTTPSRARPTRSTTVRSAAAAFTSAGFVPAVDRHITGARTDAGDAIAPVDHAVVRATRPIPGALARATHVSGVGEARPGRVTALRRRLMTDRAHTAATVGADADRGTLVEGSRSAATRRTAPPEVAAAPQPVEAAAALATGVGRVRRSTGSTTLLDVGSRATEPGTTAPRRKSAQAHPWAPTGPATTDHRGRRSGGTAPDDHARPGAGASRDPALDSAVARPAPPRRVRTDRGPDGPGVPATATAWRTTLTGGSTTPLRRSVLPPRAPVRLAPSTPGIAAAPPDDTAVGLSILRRSLSSAATTGSHATNREEVTMSALPTSGPESARSADLHLDGRLLAKLADALEDDLTDRIARRVERRLLEETALRTTGLTPGAF